MNELRVFFAVIDIRRRGTGEEEKERRNDKQTRRVQPHLLDDFVAFR